MKAIKKLIDAIAAWLFTPSKAKETYPCCQDAEEDEKKQKLKKPGGWIY